MKKFVEKWDGKIIEDLGCYCSDEFKQFARGFKRALAKELGPDYSVECFSINHYDFSGFVKDQNNKYVYFSYSLNRHFPLKLITPEVSYMEGLLYRTAANTKDYTGGRNHFTSVLNSADSIKKLFCC